MRRREFITFLSGAVAWPLAARAQQPERVRRIGVLLGVDNADSRASYAAFLQALQQLGWIDGQNVRIETRWAGGSASDLRKYATEIVALAPDIILTNGASAMVPLLQATQTVPIVFTSVADPVGAGFVDTMAHPGGNATGFIQFEREMGGAAQANRAGRHPRGSSPRSQHTHRDWTVRCHPVRSAVGRDGSDSDQRA